VRQPSEAVDAHVADSLSGLEVAALREAGRMADIGAGAGFPGLVLAVALPRTAVDLVESARRKCEVISRLAVAAAAHNARSVAARAEEWGAREGAGQYGAVTARALASLPVLVEYAAPLLAQGGTFVAWKGVRDQDEELAGREAACKLGLQVVEVRRVQPFPAARDRHLHVFRKVAATPAGYPRRPGMARKRPLGA